MLLQKYHVFVAQSILGLSTIIYLDDFEPTSLRTMSAGISTSMASGIRVVVHGSGEVPDLARAISIGPGAETTLTLSAIERTRLKYPYPSQCTDQKYVGDEDTSVIYSANACNDVCVQQQVFFRSMFCFVLMTLWHNYCLLFKLSVY